MFALAICRKPAANSAGVYSMSQALAKTGPSPSAALARREDRERVVEALGELSEDDREILLLRLVEQLSTKETAAVLGIAEGTVGSRQFRALKRRRSIEKELLPFLKTAVDFDIFCEVGFHELTKTPLTVKHLILLELAPQMTVFRRLNRLCDLDVIVRTRAARDGRVHELRLAANVRPLLLRYAGITADVE